MKYFKDAQNAVYAYESDGSQDEFIDPEFTPITSAEADALRAAPVVAPTIISMAQARLALYQSGRLDLVEAIIAEQGRAAQIEWQCRQTVERTHPLVQLVKSELPLTEQQVDDLFILGASL